MSDTQDSTSKELSAKQKLRRKGESVNQTEGANRVDAAHSLGKAAEASVQVSAAEISPASQSAESLSAVAGYGQSYSVTQLRIQAEQLAELLRDQQKKLDRREAQFNARTALIENELRTSRIWFRERELDFVDREKLLQNQISQLELRATEIAAIEISSEEENLSLQKRIIQECRNLEDREKELRAREHCLAQEKKSLEAAKNQYQQEKENAVKTLLVEKGQAAASRDSSERIVQELKENLERSRSDLKEKEKTLESLQQASTAQSQSAAQWRTKHQELDEMLAMLNKHLEDLKKDQKLFESEREKLHAQINWERQALAEERRTLELENSNQKKKLLQRGESLKKRLAATTQMREDISDMHRESLEMRLVAEQLWLELAGEKATAQLTQSISRIRTKLADHYRYANQSLGGQKEEILRLGLKLDEKKRTLHTQQEEMQTWVRRRHNEIEEQAARLVAREHELDLREKAISGKLKQSAKEKYELQEQIRRLLGSKDRQGMKIA